MMINKEIEGQKFCFVCSCRSNRSGFVHETDLYRNGINVKHSKAQYYNRTWEAYTYQTVCRGAVYDMLAQRTDSLKDVFKASKGYKVLSGARKDEFKEYLNNDKEMAVLNKLYNSL